MKNYNNLDRLMYEVSVAIKTSSHTDKDILFSKLNEHVEALLYDMAVLRSVKEELENSLAQECFEQSMRTLQNLGK